MADILAFVSGKPFDDELKNELYKRYIYYNYDETRVILSPANKSTNFTSYSCNGLVLQQPSDENKDWKILSCPPVAASTVPLPKNIGSFKIYPARDGSVITFYYYQGRWQMSSTRGIDVGPIMWDGMISFEDAFYSSLPLLKEKFLSILDKNRNMNYSFGFRNSLLHPFSSESVCSFWFIQAYDLLTNKICNVPEFAEYEQRQISGTFTKAQLLENCANSVKNYEEKNEVNHGYVLKNDRQTFYLESKLHSIISDLYYDSSYVVNCKRYGVARHYYMMVSVYAHRNDKIFAMLFPGLPYLGMFADFQKKLNIAIDIIRDHMFRNIECTPIYKELIESIQRNITIKVADKEFETNVRSAILTPSNIPLLLRLFA